MSNIEERGGYSSLSEYLVGIRKYYLEKRRDGRLWKTAGHMEEGDDTQGGFLVPEEWASGIYEAAALEGAVVRPRARVFRTKRDSFKLRTLVDSDRSSNVFGGITFTWLAEAGMKSSAANITKPAVGEIELSLHKLVGGCFVSNELEDDAENFRKFIEASFGAAIRFIEDDYFINGTGAGQPLGIMNSGAMVSVTRGGMTVLDFTDFAHMAERLLPDSWNRAVWLFNPDAIDELFEATASAANQATGIDLATMTIFGRPIIVTEKCAALGTTGDVILADFQHYAIAEKELLIAASRHVDRDQDYLEVTYSSGFTHDETFWKVVLRVDGQPLLSAPITPRRGANTLSPFVCLTTSS